MTENNQATVECDYCNALLPDMGPSAQQWCSEKCKDDWYASEELTSRGLSKGTWDRWSDKSRYLFDAVRESLTSMGWDVTGHPDAPAIENVHFETVAHNAAFTAAHELWNMEQNNDALFGGSKEAEGV